jgi:hypothetical protein
MPDSFPPLGWGPPPFDERDLDALLSGDTTDTPVALRQVADALAALRAAPTQAELTGEAVARAEFRALVLDEGARTDGLPYDQVLSALTLDGARRHPARHGGRPVRRRRRSSTRPLTRRGGILLGVAAAVVIVVVVAFNGSLSGPIQRLARSAAISAPASTHPAPRPSQSLNGSGKKTEQTARPTRSAPSTHRTSPAANVTPGQGQTQASGSCRTYYRYFLHSRPWTKWPSAEVALLEQLSKQAGGSSRVYTYCARYLGGMFPRGMPWWAYPLPGTQPGAPPPPGAGNQGNGQQGNSGPTGAHRSGPPAP